MKTRLFKKVLSAFLAVMIIVTSIPMMALTASAATAPSANDQVVKDLDEAMNHFYDFLKGEGAFTNVEQAYEAYVNCQRARDAYIYGGETDAITDQASKLNKAVDEKIGYYSLPSANKIPKFMDGETSYGDMNGYYKGVLWGAASAPARCSETSGINKNNKTDSSVKHTVYYPETTLLYVGDGNNKPQTGVMIHLNATDNGKDRYVYAVSMSTKTKVGSSTTANDSTDMALNGRWHGQGGSLDFPLNIHQGEVLGYKTSSDGAGSIQLSYRGNWISSGKYAHNYYYSNTVRFDGTFANGEYIKEIIPTFVSYWGSGPGYTNTDLKITTECNGAIRVINYKALSDALVSAGANMKSVDLRTFSEGGAYKFFQRMDAAASYDPNSDFTSFNNYDGCVTNIQNYITDLGRADNFVNNSTDYAGLRNVMTDAVRATYYAGNVKADGTLKYTTESWNNFVNKYVAAQTAMGAVNDNASAYNNYNNGNIARYASELKTAYDDPVDGLIQIVTRVDTTELMAAIDTFLKYENIFTDATYENALNVVNAAKAAVWTDEEGYVNYGVKDAALVLSDENTEIVTQQLENVNNAVKALRIDMDVVISTSVGHYSLNQAQALIKIVEPVQDDYWNYKDLSSLVSASELYETNAANADFTDYTAQYNEYKQWIEDIVNQYNNLEESFVKLISRNGVIANAGTVNTVSQAHSERDYQWTIDMSYPTGVVLFQNSHEDATFKYGNFGIKFTSNVEGKSNNKLDSININADDYADAHYAGGKDAVVVPPNMYEEQRDNNGSLITAFGVNNFKVTDKTDSTFNYYGTLDDGTQIFDPNNTAAYDAILGNTNGTVDDQYGGINLKAREDKQACSITLNGDINVFSPGSPAGQITPEEYAQRVSRTYKHDHYIGASYHWNFKYLTSSYHNTSFLRPADKMISQVTVIDVSYLRILISDSSELIANENIYTEDSYKVFDEAFGAANARMNYPQLAASQISTQIITRYRSLKEAKDALKLCANNESVMAAYYAAQAIYDAGNADGKYTDDTWADFAAAYEAAKTTVVDASGKYSATNIRKCEADKEQAAVDAYATALTTAQAALIETATLSVDWAVYEAACNALGRALGDEVLSVAALENAAATIAGYTYINYTDAEKAAAPYKAQSPVNTEAAAINELASALEANRQAISAIDFNAAKAQVKAESDKYTFDDMYSGDNIKLGSITKAVNVNGVDYIGYIYSTQGELDNAVAAAIDSQNKTIRQYNITLNGADLTTVSYGTQMIIKSDGSFTTGSYDVENIDTTGLAKAAWYYSYGAPSRGEGTDTRYNMTASKYMTVDGAFGFIVKGDTAINTVVAEADDTSAGYVVKIVNAVNNKIIDVIYTDASGNFTMPDSVPAYAFYNFTGFNDGFELGAAATVSADTIIKANYEAETSNPYTITYCNQYLEPITVTADYNELVELKSDDAKYTDEQKAVMDEDGTGYDDSDIAVWCSYESFEDGSYFDLNVLYYGKDFSFYACQDIDIMALTQSEYEYIVTTPTYDDLLNPVENGYVDDWVRIVNSEEFNKTADNNYVGVTVKEQIVPVYVNNALYKFSMVGNYIAPDNYTVVEAGILFTSQSGADLTLENVGNDGIARMKASRFTVGNQFTINVKAPSNGKAVTFDYCAYVVVSDGNNITTIYSKTCPGTTAGL